MVKAGISGAEWSREAAAFSVIERIAPHVWRVVENDAHESCTYLVVGTERVALVDGSSASSYGLWVDSFLQATVPGAAKLPRLCINTHRGRAGGNASLQKLGVEIAASARPRAAAPHAFEPYTIDRWLQNEEEIALGGGALVVLQTPGHTPDSLCLWYARDQILFAGGTITAKAEAPAAAPAPPAPVAAPAPTPTPQKKKKSLWGAFRGAVTSTRKAPKAAPAADHRSRLVALYTQHDPAKLNTIDATLEACAGREADLWKLLRATYEAPAAAATGPPAATAHVDVATQDSSIFDLRESLSRVAFVAKPVKTIACGRGPTLGANALPELLQLVEDAVTGKVSPTARDEALTFARGGVSFRAHAYELPQAQCYLCATNEPPTQPGPGVS